MVLIHFHHHYTMYEATPPTRKRCKIQFCHLLLCIFDKRLNPSILGALEFDQDYMLADPSPNSSLFMRIFSLPKSWYWSICATKIKR